jgi:hypothetical protein
MLWGKWRDPLLGILGVHLMLQSDKPNLEDAEDIVERLQGIMGDFRHPDVDALRLEIARRRDVSIDMPPFEAPPMLRHSWNILIKATSEMPDLIPYDSLPFKISDLLWGASAWLIWEMPSRLTEMKDAGEYARTSPAGTDVDVDDYGDRLIIGDVTLYKREHAKTSGDLAGIVERGGTAQPPDTDTNIDLSDFESLRSAISELLSKQGSSLSGSGMDEFTQNAQLSGVEYALLSQFQGRQIALDKGYTIRHEQPITSDLLVRQFSIPAEMVLEAMGNLYVKLKIYDQGAG